MGGLDYLLDGRMLILPGCLPLLQAVTSHSKYWPVSRLRTEQHLISGPRSFKMLLVFFKADLQVSFEEANSFPPRLYWSLIIRWRVKEIKSRRRIVVSPIAISASPCLPPEKLAPGLSSPTAALHLQSHIAFSRACSGH